MPKSAEKNSLSNKPTDVNESQWKAINSDSQNLLIVAGPGTGKTHTLTYRIIKTVSKLKESENILAITFTNKAALEMKERLQKKFENPADKIFVGTFHSFCLSLLFKYCQEAKLPNDFKVITPDEIIEATKDLWPDKSKAQRKDILDEISKIKSKILSNDININSVIARSLLGDETISTEKIASLPSVARNDTVYHLINELDHFLKSKGLLDFDSLLVEAVDLLKSNSAIQTQIQKRYHYIFVDEYQDINPLQHELLKLLANANSQLTAIGDPNQAIYSFRGSDVHFFESFKDDFKNVSILSLSDNYRSTPNLIKASAQVIAQGNFYVPELTANILKEGKLTIHESATEKGEAEYAVHSIEKLVGGTSMFSHDSGRVEKHLDGNFSFGDIAVLYRLNTQRKALEEALKRSGIPYQVSGEEGHYSEYALDVKAEKVNLLTMHAAKGLEFSVVFIVGCEENLLPLNLALLKGDLEEERRLFYVAMTRAKELLYLTYAKKRMIFGKTYKNKPSLFIASIEEKLKEFEQAKITPKKKATEETQLKLFS